ncbi:NYN domain-containing protein [Helicobacter bilis]|uniref:NYN domain-containing protein n=1 Tax=Helicobacter bilis TaxID=37372 RepID=UPI00248DA7D0|nr:NYN domain-containing protein [Helicobacter bilis]
MAVKRPRVAIVFDSENNAAQKRERITTSMERVLRHGNFVLKAAFGFASKRLQRTYREYGITNYSRNGRIDTQKNIADMRICKYAKEHYREFDCLVIVSDDNDFTPLLTFLKEKGKRVVVYGTQKVGRMLLCESNEYYELRKVCQ